MNVVLSGPETRQLLAAIDPSFPFRSAPSPAPLWWCPATCASRRLRSAKCLTPTQSTLPSRALMAASREGRGPGRLCDRQVLAVTRSAACGPGCREAHGAVLATGAQGAQASLS